MGIGYLRGKKKKGLGTTEGGTVFILPLYKFCQKGLLIPTSKTDIHCQNLNNNVGGCTKGDWPKHFCGGIGKCYLSPII